MKTKLLLLTLCMGSLSVFAQSNDRPVDINNNAHCKSFPNMPARAVPVFPKTAYTPLEDPSCPPCYKYRSKYGYMVMECPYLRFPAEHGNKEEPISGEIKVPANNNSIDMTSSTDNALSVQAQNAYTGNYPKVCKRDPNMPANAKPVWPKGEYTLLQDPSCPPCYEYRSKYGYKVMECPFLRFPAEHNRQ